MVQHDQPVGLDGIGVAFDDERAVADAPGALGRRIAQGGDHGVALGVRRPQRRLGSRRALATLRDLGSCIVSRHRLGRLQLRRGPAR